MDENNTEQQYPLFYPIFIDLPANSSEANNDNYISNAMKGFFTDKQLQQMKQDFPTIKWIFFFDSYDELPNTPNLYKNNNLSYWGDNIKVITTCRTQYIKRLQRYDINYFLGQQQSKDNFCEIYMSILSDQDIKLYINLYFEHAKAENKDLNKDQYFKILDTIPGVKSFMSTIFRANMLLNIFPKLELVMNDNDSNNNMNILARTNTFIDSCYKQPILSILIYELYTKETFQREIEKAIKNAQNNLDILYFQQYCEQLSNDMFKNNHKTKVKYNPNNHMHKKGKWHKYFSDVDVTQMIFGEITSLIKKGALLNYNSKRYQYEFIHKSIQDYFISCQILRDIYEFYCNDDTFDDDDDESIPNLNYKHLNLFFTSFKRNESGKQMFYKYTANEEQMETIMNSSFNKPLQAELLTFISEFAMSNVNWLIDALFLIIFISKDKKYDIQYASSNAISILNSLSFISFSKIDFSNIQIPYANLNYSICDGTNFFTC